MVYFCADDYGLCDAVSSRIIECIDNGALNKVSVFPNFEELDFDKPLNNKDVRLSLHLNLVEGKCMANYHDIPLIADKSGNLKYDFTGLLKLSIFNKKEFEAQIYKEIKAQILYYKSVLPKEAPFCVDSHQHTHMIPSVFKTLLKVLNEEEINVSYMRIPAEPIMPFIKTPSLYFTYSAVNIIKQWLLNFLWLINKREFKKNSIPTAYFFGILFSGKMDEKRVKKILPKYLKIAKKHGKDIEVLFHPGYLAEEELGSNKNIIFQNFYFSKNRKTEYDSVMNI